MSDSPPKRAEPHTLPSLNYQGALGLGIIATCFWTAMGGCMFWMPVGCILSSQGAATIPLLIIFGISLVIGGLTMWGNLRLQRDRMRRRYGLCVKCGYDCRHNYSRCPECGGALPDKVIDHPNL